MTANAGYHAFSTGDVLTAAQVQYNLQNQTIMYFASSAARTTALSGVLVEGMFSYLADTDSTEYYNGSAWTSISNPGDITAVTAGTGITGGGTSGAVTITNDMATTITTAGDLIKGTGSGTYARLGIGSTGQVLTVSGGAPTWATPASGGGMTQILAPTSLGTSNTYTTSSLSGSYNQLVIYLKDFKASNYFGLSVRFNSDSTADAYQSANLVASTSTAAYGEAYRGTFGSMFNNMYASTDDNFAMITIPNYANATTRKVAFGNAAYLADDTNWATQIGSVAWKNTSAITTISFLSFDQNYSAGVWSGGTVEIYGVN